MAYPGPPRGRPEMEEEEMPDMPLAFKAISYSLQAMSYIMTGVKYGWMPFTILMGASSLYCGPSLIGKELFVESDVTAAATAAPPQ